MALPLVEVPEQVTSDEIDEEILEIFLEEVEEVLEDIRTNYTDWKNNPSDKAALQNVRRAFHTLKGSGRLVGAMSIGELGWHFETMLNRILDGTMSTSSVMFKLIDQVEDMIPPLIEQFKSGAPPFYEAVLLMSQAKQLTDSKGADIGEFVSQAEAGLAALGDTDSAAMTSDDALDLDAVDVAAVDDSLDLDAMDAADDALELDDEVALADDLDDTDAASADMDELDTVVDNALDLDSLETAGDDSDDADLSMSDLGDEMDLGGLDTLMDNALADTLAELPADLGDEFAAITDTSLDLGDALDSMDDLSELNATLELPDELTMPESLADLTETIGDELSLSDELDSSELADLMSQEALAAEAAEEQAMLDKMLPPDVASPSEDERQAHEMLLKIFHNEANDHLLELKQAIVACKSHLPCPCTEKLFRIFHTLNGSSRSVELNTMSTLAGAAEKFVRFGLDFNLSIHKEHLGLMVETGKLFQAILKNELEGQQANYDKVLGRWQAINAELSEQHSVQEKSLYIDDDEDDEEIEVEIIAEEPPLPPTAVTPAPKPAPEPELSHEEDAVDDEFLEIFLEEADEILETSQSLIGRWLVAPNSMPLLKELQRELHTLKGGARMVGISSMGDLSHQLESVLTRIVEGNAQSNSRFQELVQQSLDELASMLEIVRDGKTPPAATTLVEEIKVVIDGKPKAAAAPSAPKEPTTQSAEVTEAAEEAIDEVPATKAVESTDKTAAEKAAAASIDDNNDGDERVRVRAALIDKLTNLAGEMSIQRAHMEQQQGGARTSLNEMEQTIVRLRDQLRRLDIETEVQIVSHFGDQHGPDEEDFDPLEMDRFSTMQQLSRSLMETVGDLQNIQESLKNTIRQSENLLIQQNRIGSDMQDSIMSTRLVPFSQISPRLQRIARLTSRELKKQIEFIINDDSLEFERTILNRIVAPLEHMLRNAIGHGVELPEQRRSAGKPPAATVKIDLSQEGAEIIIRMNDDGAGINTDAIRKKAEKKGLLQSGQDISEQDLIAFILEPAFSTAEKITQVSGRGVGMDIVNSEIKQLSGSLNIYSSRGHGTTFEIRIPTSLTITKCLLVHVGEETLAIPVDNVDAVLRVPREQVLPSASRGKEIHHFDYMGHSYRTMHLADLLSFTQPSSVDTALLPMLLVSSGDNRLALLIDGVEGSKEMAVKPVGPQLSSIRWLAGATILGDGRVVLILDVLTLMRMVMTHHLEPRLTANAEHAEALAALEIAKPKVRTVMVVDDSITVRKVTARFLKRQGLEVVTAKDGLDAVGQLQEMKPDIMLLDVEMPRMDGFELATQIRNDERLKDLPIIMITSRTGEKHRERASKIGIDRHLGKPFNENELLANIDELLTERGK